MAKNTEFKKVSVIGLGYIGLPTAAVIASRGIDVVGVEVNQQTIDTINKGDVHIVEPDLDIIVRAVVTTGKLKATQTPEAADAFMVAVPTPFKGESHEPDLSYIHAAAEMIAPVLEKGNLVVLESTSPVGTTEKLAGWLKQYRDDLSFPQDKGDAADIKISHCPERVLPGHILHELVSNDRVVGGLSKACSQRAVELYSTFVKGECIVSNARTAELAKLTENAFRDVNIAFANELSIICDKLKINVWELIQLANRHPRVNILKPGPGVGGHCIAVDPWFIVNTCPDEAKIIRQARITNQLKTKYVTKKILEAADQFKNPVVACLGITFKADIDDLRESPAVKIVQDLISNLAAKIIVVDPNVNRKMIEEKVGGVKIEILELNQAISAANIVVILVDHIEFKSINMSDLAEKVVIDSQGIL